MTKSLPWPPCQTGPLAGSAYCWASPSAPCASMVGATHTTSPQVPEPVSSGSRLGGPPLTLNAPPSSGLYAFAFTSPSSAHPPRPRCWVAIGDTTLTSPHSPCLLTRLSLPPLWDSCCFLSLHPALNRYSINARLILTKDCLLPSNQRSCRSSGKADVGGRIQILSRVPGVSQGALPLALRRS